MEVVVAIGHPPPSPMVDAGHRVATLRLEAVEMTAFMLANSSTSRCLLGRARLNYTYILRFIMRAIRTVRGSQVIVLRKGQCDESRTNRCGIKCRVCPSRKNVVLQ